MSKYGVFSGLYFPVFGLNAEIYGANLRIQSKYLHGPYREKYRPENTPYLDTFHAIIPVFSPNWGTYGPENSVFGYFSGSKSPYSVQIQEIRTRKNSLFGHLSRSFWQM